MCLNPAFNKRQNHKRFLVTMDRFTTHNKNEAIKEGDHKASVQPPECAQPRSRGATTSFQWFLLRRLCSSNAFCPLPFSPLLFPPLPSGLLCARLTCCFPIATALLCLHCGNKATCSLPYLSIFGPPDIIGKNGEIKSKVTTRRS